MTGKLIPENNSDKIILTFPKQVMHKEYYLKDY